MDYWSRGLLVHGTADYASFHAWKSTTRKKSVTCRNCGARSSRLWRLGKLSAYCSHKCRRTAITKRLRERDAKRVKGTAKPATVARCIRCGDAFKTGRIKRAPKFCSRDCLHVPARYAAHLKRGYRLKRVSKPKDGAFRSWELYEKGKVHTCRVCGSKYCGVYKPKAYGKQLVFCSDECRTESKRISRRKARRRRTSTGFCVTHKVMAEHWDWKCAACKIPFDLATMIELDHVVPRAKGGGNGVENCQPLCRECNASKSDRLVDEWAAERFGQEHARRYLAELASKTSITGWRGSRYSIVGHNQKLRVMTERVFGHIMKRLEETST